jgi:hypothetical protein
MRTARNGCATKVCYSGINSSAHIVVAVVFPFYLNPAVSETAATDLFGGLAQHLRCSHPYELSARGRNALQFQQRDSGLFQ